jgi:hypothetical protein
MRPVVDSTYGRHHWYRSPTEISTYIMTKASRQWVRTRLVPLRDTNSSRAVLPILVAVGVKDSAFQYFLNDETGPLKNTDYLFLPSIR